MHIDKIIFSLLIKVARIGFSQSSFTTVEEAGTAVLVVNSNGANPDPVIVGYTVEEGNTLGTYIHACV